MHVVAIVVGARVAIGVEDEVAIVVVIEKPEWNLESMAITGKEDIVELYVLKLGNPGIYPDKDEEEGHHLEWWQRGHGAQTRATEWTKPKVAEVDRNIQVFSELGRVFAGFAEAGNGEEVD